MAVRISCLKSIIKKNGKTFPVLIGMATGRQIHGFSLVPNFDVSDANVIIANRLLAPLDDKWQRPADEKRIGKIDELYKNQQVDQIMVNPVLLGAIPGQENLIRVIEQRDLPGSTNSQTVITIEFSNPDAVWVIDGQHRINGMKKSNQPMPFVLLFDDSGNSNYTGAYLAELFSIVTTEAKQMKTIHKEWMSYAFKLDKYKDKIKRDMMKIILLLATKSDFGVGHSNENYFYDQIQFNDEKKVNSDIVGAFHYTAPLMLKRLDTEPGKQLLSHYSNTEIASSISDFIHALKVCHGAPTSESILFGKMAGDFMSCLGYGLTEAWLWYISTLSKLPTYSETLELTKKIGVHTTHWEILPWTSGPGTTQKNAIRSTSRNAFFNLLSGITPCPNDLGEYLLGKIDTHVTFRFGILTNGQINQDSIIEKKIDACTNLSDIVFEIPKYHGQIRNHMIHHYMRGADPTQLGEHTPNCRVSSFKLTDERGRLKMAALDSFNKMRNQTTGINIGTGRSSYVEIETKALDEKKVFAAHIKIVSID
jgi:hypothetical protein